MQVASNAVEDAWRRVKVEDTQAARDAFDLAYARWEELCPLGTRGVGRKVSGDDQPMTSSQRAHAARARQQQSAARWERVAPIIQALRKAIDHNDQAAALEIARSLAKETQMILKNFSVVHAQTDPDVVVVHGYHDRQLVISFVPTMHLEDRFRRHRLTGKLANLLVDRNLNDFASIISAKYERGEYKAYSRAGGTYPRVDITLADIEACDESISDSVLDVAAGAGWADANGKWSPAYPPNKQ